MQPDLSLVMNEDAEAVPAGARAKTHTKRSRGLTAFASIAAGGLVIQLLTAASGPLVARMLGPAGRGQMVTITVVAILASQLGMGGLPAAIAHAVARAGAPARDVVRGHLRLWLALMLLPAAASVGLTAALLAGDPLMPVLATAGFVVTLFAAWQLLLAGMLQGEGNVRHVNALRLSGLIAYVASIVAIFVTRQIHESAVLLFVFAAAQVVGLVVGWTRLQDATGDPDARVPRSDIHLFARRSWISGVGALDGLGVDHLLVGALLGQASLGLYAVAVSVTNVPTIVLGGVAAILLPRMAAGSASEGITVLRRWLLAAVALDLMMVVCLQALIAPAIRILFGDEFVPATTSARILIVAWAFLALRRVLTAAAQAQGRAKQASTVEALCAGILIVGVAVGGKLNGIEGAALAMATVGVLSCIWLAFLVSWRPRASDTSSAPQNVGVSEVVAMDDSDLRLP